MGFSCKFNGSTSKVDTQSTFGGLTGAITILAWINPSSFGEVGVARIVDNGEAIIWVQNYKVYFTSNNFSNETSSAAGSITLNKLQFIVVTREADGTVNFYIGDKDNAPTSSGAADQDSGTPEAGTTNVIIGNNAAGTRTFDGTINKIAVVEGILSLAEISRYWSSSLREVN